jgi:predicted ArsR family transcriptional regulator
VSAPALLANTPAARATDPDTSHQAAAEITADGTRAAQQQRTLDGVTRYPGLTSRELAQRLGMDRHAIARRLPELEAADLVQKDQVRRCSIGGRSAVTWRTASPAPQLFTTTTGNPQE